MTERETRTWLTILDALEDHRDNWAEAVSLADDERGARWCALTWKLFEGRGVPRPCA